MKPRGQALDKRLRTTFMERAQGRTKGSSLNDRDRWLEVGPEDRAGRASSASGPVGRIAWAYRMSARRMPCRRVASVNPKNYNERAQHAASLIVMWF
jgi:hypothetical protein